MKTFITFLKKEILEQLRTHRIMILGLIFIFFGILNPLTAKITPMLLEMLSDSMASSGIIVEEVEITALDSWMQFYKNLPMLLIIFIFMQSSIFTKEYQKGTLTLVLTKGFERYKIVLTKVITITFVWTIGYLICFGITYVYSWYFWDNSIVNNLLFSALIWWIFGIFVITLYTLLTINFENNGGALAITGGLVFGMYLLGLLPKINQYLPTLLTNGNSLNKGLEEVGYYIPSLIITLCLSILFVIGSILIFNKKKL